MSSSTERFYLIDLEIRPEERIMGHVVCDSMLSSTSGKDLAIAAFIDGRHARQYCRVLNRAIARKKIRGFLP